MRQIIRQGGDQEKGSPSSLPFTFQRALWRGMLITTVLLVGCVTMEGPEGPASTPSTPAPTVPSAPSAPAGHGAAGWRLSTLLEAGTETVVLEIHDQPVASLPRHKLLTLRSIALRLEQASGLPAEWTDWVVLASGRPNAYAYWNGERGAVAITLGMMELLADDVDAWAALLGHELAHLTQNHRRQREARQGSRDTGASLIGLALGVAGIPVGDLITTATATVMNRASSRDDEREADRLGLEYARRAGFDPDGAARLFTRLVESGGESGLKFLSTHPAGAERIETMRRLSAEEHQKNSSNGQ